MFEQLLHYVATTGTLQIDLKAAREARRGVTEHLVDGLGCLSSHKRVSVLLSGLYDRFTVKTSVSTGHPLFQ